MSKKILKIAVKGDNGLKGAVITYEKPSKRIDINFRDSVRHTYRAPLHNDLTDAVKAFRDDVIVLLQLDSNIAHEDITVTEVEAHDGWFKIGAMVRSINSTEYKVTTPKVEKDASYADEEKVWEKIQRLYKEIRAYISEKKVMDPAQIVMQFNKGNEDFNPEEFDKLTHEEKLAEARRFLEKNNMIVVEMEQPVENPAMEMVSENEFAQSIGMPVGEITELTPAGGKIVKLPSEEREIEGATHIGGPYSQPMAFGE